jgi:hypothetical protein
VHFCETSRAPIALISPAACPRNRGVSAPEVLLDVHGKEESLKPPLRRVSSACERHFFRPDVWMIKKKHSPEDLYDGDYKQASRHSQAHQIVIDPVSVLKGAPGA